MSEDQSDLFLLSLGAVAKQIRDTINRFLIPQLVDFNFDGVEEYPEISFEKIGSVDYTKIATILSTLASAEILKPDEDLEDHIREMLELPARMEQPEGEVPEEPIEEPEEPEEPEDEEPIDNDQELDDLQSELDALQAAESPDEEDLEMVMNVMLSEMEFACDFMEENSFAFVAK